jgi:hypothetical protein
VQLLKAMTMELKDKTIIITRASSGILVWYQERSHTPPPPQFRKRRDWPLVASRRLT